MLLNGYSDNWKNHFPYFTYSKTSDCLPSIKVRIVPDWDDDTYEIWEAVNYYGVTNLH